MNARKPIKGQSLVEFALIFPIFFFLVTGLFDLGRAVFAYATMNNAAREGTRYAIVRLKTTPDEAIQDNVRTYFYNVQDFLDNTVIDINRVGDEDNPKINIHITYTFAPITPGLSHVLGEGKTLSIEAESEMYIAPIGK
jgi:Flp pilus assembly protein TadG